MMIQRNSVYNKYLSSCENISIYSEVDVVSFPKFKKLTMTLNSWEVAKGRSGEETDTLSDDLFQVKLYNILNLIFGGYIRVERREKVTKFLKKQKIKAHQKEIGYSMVSHVNDEDTIYEILEFLFIEIKQIVPEKFWQQRKERTFYIKDRDCCSTITTFKIPLEYFYEIDYFNKYILKGEYDLKKINIHFELIVEHKHKEFDLSELYPLWLAY